MTYISIFYTDIWERVFFNYQTLIFGGNVNKRKDVYQRIFYESYLFDIYALARMFRSFIGNQQADINIIYMFLTTVLGSMVSTVNNFKRVFLQINMLG